VLGLDIAVQHYLVATFAESESEIYILDRGYRELLTVKAAVRNKNTATHSTQPGPKSRRVASGVLVHEMMLEIFVLRKEILLCWFVVVRTEKCRYLWPAFEPVGNEAERVGLHNDIRVDEH
jgi:hypothetical protein